MRLGHKARLFLELALILGEEALEGIRFLPVLYRHGCGSGDDRFHHALERLTQGGWLEENELSPNPNAWVTRLTVESIDRLTDAIDPNARWNGDWDGRWNVFAFDLLMARSGERQALRDWLKRRRFGRLQGSVWVSPQMPANWSKELKSLGVGSQSAVSVQGEIVGAPNEFAIVERAWDLASVNDNYAMHAAFLKSERPTRAEKFAAWCSEERRLWNAAFADDPFLPRRLWPSWFAQSYLGPECLKQRKERYLEIAKRLATAAP